MFSNICHCKRLLRIHMIREDLDTFCKESSSYAFDPQLELRILNWLQIIEKEPSAKGQTYCTGFGIIQSKKSKFSNSVKEHICPCNRCTFIKFINSFYTFYLYFPCNIGLSIMSIPYHNLVNN